MAKILNFGLSHLITPALSAELPEYVTAYLSPEQLQGKEVDVRTDIFSFAAVLYEMATLRPAFTGDSAVALRAVILRREPPSFASLQLPSPPRFEGAIQTGLDKDRGMRFQSVAEFRYYLQFAMRNWDESLKTPTEQLRELAIPLRRGAPLPPDPARIALAWAGLVIVGAILAIAGIVWYALLHGTH